MGGGGAVGAGGGGGGGVAVVLVDSVCEDEEGVEEGEAVEIGRVSGILLLGGASITGLKFPPAEDTGMTLPPLKICPWATGERQRSTSSCIDKTKASTATRAVDDVEGDLETIMSYYRAQIRTGRSKVINGRMRQGIWR